MEVRWRVAKSQAMRKLPAHEYAALYHLPDIEKRTYIVAPGDDEEWSFIAHK